MAFHAIFLVLLVVLSFVLITKNPSAGTVAEILRGDGDSSIAARDVVVHASRQRVLERRCLAWFGIATSSG